MKEYIFNPDDERMYYFEYEELIRCPDCKHCVTYYHGPEAPDMFTFFCNHHGIHPEQNDYCSWAERKEDHNND